MTRDQIIETRQALVAQLPVTGEVLRGSLFERSSALRLRRSWFFNRIFHRFSGLIRKLPMAAGVAGGPTTGRNRRAARRSEEQVEVMHALWGEPHVTFKGKWHTIEDAGINPRPARSTCSASCAP